MGQRPAQSFRMRGRVKFDCFDCRKTSGSAYVEERTLISMRFASRGTYRNSCVFADLNLQSRSAFAAAEPAITYIDCTTLFSNKI